MRARTFAVAIIAMAAAGFAGPASAQQAPAAGLEKAASKLTPQVMKA